MFPLQIVVGNLILVTVDFLNLSLDVSVDSFQT